MGFSLIELSETNFLVDMYIVYTSLDMLGNYFAFKFQMFLCQQKYIWQQHIKGLLYVSIQTMQLIPTESEVRTLTNAIFFFFGGGLFLFVFIS